MRYVFVPDQTAAEVTSDSQMKMLLDIRSNQSCLHTIHRHEGLLFKVTAKLLRLLICFILIWCFVCLVGMGKGATVHRTIGMCAHLPILGL